jgi:predicted nucleic acid-binding Zn ribbon protein
VARAIYHTTVNPIQHVAPTVLAEIIRRQPASKEKTRFAWQLAVGPSLARVTTVDLRNGVLRVTAADARWTREIQRSSELVLARLQHLLGADVVARLSISD